MHWIVIWQANSLSSTIRAYCCLGWGGATYKSESNCRQICALVLKKLFEKLGFFYFSVCEACNYFTVSFSGLIHIKKKSRINCLLGHDIDTTDWAFKLKRKKFVIEVRPTHMRYEILISTNCWISCVLFFAFAVSMTNGQFQICNIYILPLEF